MRIVKTIAILAMIVIGVAAMGMPSGNSPEDQQTARILGLVGLGLLVGAWLWGAQKSGKIYTAGARHNDQELREFEALDEESKTPARMQKAAEAFLARNKPKKALPLLERVIAAEPENIPAHYQLGQLRFAFREFTDAWRHFDAVYRTDANFDYGEIKLWAARTFLALKEPQPALLLAENFLEKERVHLLGLFVKAEALRELGKADDARGVYREFLAAFEQAPDFQQARYRDLSTMARRHAG